MRVIILSGPSGSGKSTQADAHTGGVASYWSDKARICSADNYFTNSLGEYNFNPARLPDAHAACLFDFLAALEFGAEVIVVDNTNTTVAEVAPYYALASAYNYEVSIEVIRPSAEEIEAIAARNVHGVPLETVKAQLDRIENNLLKQAPPWWSINEVQPAL